MSATGYDLITEEMFQEALARIEALEAALRKIADDVEKFERVNHLYEKSAAIIAIARDVLAEGPLPETILDEPTRPPEQDK